MSCAACVYMDVCVCMFEGRGGAACAYTCVYVSI